jgi:hypothetical protein
MRILLVASAYNSMTQRVHLELADRGHEVSVELARFESGRYRPGQPRSQQTSPVLARRQAAGDQQ